MKIHEVFSLLTSVLIDWSHFIAESHFIRSSTEKGQCITWEDYLTGSLPDPPLMRSHVAHLYEKKQYTFLVQEDNSVIQMFSQYDTKGKNLKEASLAFYSTKPVDRPDPEVEAKQKKNKQNESSDADGQKNPQMTETSDAKSHENEIAAQNTALTTISEDSPVIWLRIDYAPEADKGILHAACHIHLSSFPEARIPVDGVPTPTQFIELIIAFCYPEVYKKHRLDEAENYVNPAKMISLNTPSFPRLESAFLRQIAHFRIPFDERGK